MANIENYKNQFGRIPNNNEIKILKNLGFETDEIGTGPSYTKDEKDHYEIIFSGLQKIKDGSWVIQP